MKRLLTIGFLLLPLLVIAQYKYDANWVFGDSIGIDFGNQAGPLVYKVATKNAEANASISDSTGNLQLYISYNRNYSWMQTDIRDGNNNIILNGTGINVNFSATNGAVFLPVPERRDSIFLFHLGTYGTSCTYFTCIRLYYTLIVKNSNKQWVVAEKNILITSETVEESIALVKHTNGVNWWLITHQQKVNHPDSTSSNYIVFDVVKDGVNRQRNLSVNSHEHFYSFAGELVPFRNGEYLIDVVTGDNVIYIDKFDRCTGNIFAYDTLKLSLPSDKYVYSAIEVNGHLYVQYSNYDNTSWGGGIKHFFFTPDSIIELNELYRTNAISNFLSQIELTPKGEILLNHWYTGFDSTLIDLYKYHLSIARDPGTDLPFIENYYISLPSYATANIGLPNFPNYNLGPEGVFLAYAGKDTVLCNNTNSTGVPIGTPPVPNVTYLWQPAAGLSATTIAQPTANPIQSTWYYLTATDTTATSCAVNTDSVYVKVETCTGITETPSGERWDYRLKPNLFHSGKTATINLALEETGTVEIYNIQGALVGRYTLEHGKNVLTLYKSLAAAGVYIYKVYTGNQLRHTDKLVVVE